MKSTLNRQPFNYQAALEHIRTEYQFDFASIAMYESDQYHSPIKWQYVDGNLNDRYKLIVLRKGNGLAGNVMKTGKRQVIEDVDQALSMNERLKYPIILSEALTATLAIPLWSGHNVKGVLLLGQRDHKPIPVHADQIDISGKLGEFTEGI
ncbi:MULTISPECIES: nitrate respiration regulation accessory nitrate sensor NreA [Staphylococcus]|uniref:GAF domain-containing protein n=2 Tax=Staphylococcus TaxID=1279 RepID=A0A1Z3U0P9_9STAP|nr:MULTISPECIES: nitrate respiration regulation accessory nitrate sensor NreA [Staphylococcus]ASE36853.1 GAF domain-containing protein [Staphylococcus pettenkoferi]EHM71440.1 hypothetical protein SEVCU012_1933 [Staphylococcus pettenkoferi VCU012]MBX8994418.1 GAF domain-containing protein [Staphylococcus pettenkoferi]MCI2792331.1 nitrate respiration regulation accessory nitrate sensor NreA [Staphylococcus pettenkoferi]MCY1567818.1 nitrate respiration regulation accessory nitrate sensor NreA [St